jgi:hypothetical protein
MTSMTRLDKYQVLVIDDIGYVKKTGYQLKPGQLSKTTGYE